MIAKQEELLLAFLASQSQKMGRANQLATGFEAEWGCSFLCTLYTIYANALYDFSYINTKQSHFIFMNYSDIK